MATMKPKKFSVTLGGEKRPIVFDLNAFDMIEEDYPNTEVAFDAMAEGKLKAVLTVLTAALVSGDPTNPVTRQQVGSLVDMGNIGDVVNTVQEAFITSLPAETQAKIRAAQAKAKAEAEAKAAAIAAGEKVTDEPKGEAAAPAAGA